MTIARKIFEGESQVSSKLESVQARKLLVSYTVAQVDAVLLISNVKSIPAAALVRAVRSLQIRQLDKAFFARQRYRPEAAVAVATSCYLKNPEDALDLVFLHSVDGVCTDLRESRLRLPLFGV